MAETIKKAKSAPKPRKTAAKKKSEGAAAANPVTENHHVNPHEHSHENGHKRVPQEEIARLAHQFWQERGHKHGSHIDDWFRAEQHLRGKAS